MNKRAPKLKEMTASERDAAAKVRTLVDIHQFGLDGVSGAYQITEALGILIAGLGENLLPPHWMETLEVLKMTYLTMYGEQHMSALSEILGGMETVKSLMDHENGREMTNRIFERIGPLKPGQTVPTVDVKDILQEGGFVS